MREHFQFRTHYTKTFVFKLVVATEITNARRNGTLIKEISFISSLTVAFSFFLLLGVLLCVSRCRRRSKLPERKSSREETEAVFGNVLHSNSVSIRKIFRDVVFPPAEPPL